MAPDRDGGRVAVVLVARDVPPSRPCGVQGYGFGVLLPDPPQVGAGAAVEQGAVRRLGQRPSGSLLGHPHDRRGPAADPSRCPIALSPSRSQARRSGRVLLAQGRTLGASSNARRTEVEHIRFQPRGATAVQGQQAIRRGHRQGARAPPQTAVRAGGPRAGVSGAGRRMGGGRRRDAARGHRHPRGRVGRGGGRCSNMGGADRRRCFASSVASRRTRCRGGARGGGGGCCAGPVDSCDSERAGREHGGLL
mmetsp:Transcript_36990/g.106559  ORF Transcript_36990/g.106559 Transcript_36990/m.106559 type:complete len:250 (-) Transcript_36990:27-776(-)